MSCVQQALQHDEASSRSGRRRSTAARFNAAAQLVWTTGTSMKRSPVDEERKTSRKEGSSGHTQRCSSSLSVGGVAVEMGRWRER
jgi:hypothetical protein